MVDVYADEQVKVSLADKPWCNGHLIVEPKIQAPFDKLSKKTATYLLDAANTCSSILYESLQAHGTNIILNDGPTGVQVHVVARVEEDGMNFMWEPKQGDPAVNAQVASDIKSAIIVTDDEKPGAPTTKQEVQVSPPKVTVVDDKVADAPAVDEKTGKPKLNLIYYDLHRIP